MGVPPGPSLAPAPQIASAGRSLRSRWSSRRAWTATSTSPGFCWKGRWEPADPPAPPRSGAAGGEPGTPSPSCTLSSGLPHAGLTPGLFAVQPHHDAEDMGQVQPLLGAPEWQAVVTGAGVSVLTTVTNDHRPGALKHQKRAPSQPRRPEVQSLGASRPALSREAPGEGPSCRSSPGGLRRPLACGCIFLISACVHMAVPCLRVPPKSTPLLGSGPSPVSVTAS